MFACACWWMAQAVTAQLHADIRGSTKVIFEEETSFKWKADVVSQNPGIFFLACVCVCVSVKTTEQEMQRENETRRDILYDIREGADCA
jgi:hypothetical protein